MWFKKTSQGSFLKTSTKVNVGKGEIKIIYFCFQQNTPKSNTAFDSLPIPTLK